MKMPTYTPQVDVRATPMPTANVAAFTAPAAAAAAGFGRAAEQFTALGVQEAGKLNQLQEAEARSDAFKRTSSARLDQTNALIAEQAAAPEGAPNFQKNFLEKFDAYKTDTLANAPERTRPYLDQHLANLRDHLGEAALNFEATANINKRQADLDTTIDTHANVVRTDPSQFDHALGEALDAVHGSGLPADRARKAETHVKGLLATSMAEGISDRDPAQADRLLKDPRFDEFFPPAVKNQLIERNDARLEKQTREAQAALQADVKERYANELAAISDRGVGTGQLAPGMLARAFPDQAGELVKNLDDERRAYDARQAVALNSPEQDAALLERFKPEGKDYALQAGRRDAVQRAISAKWQAAPRDPVGYLTGASPTLAAAFDAAGKDPTKLPAALALSDQLQGQIGLRPDQRFVLSGSQAQSLVGQITTAPPDQAAAKIQSLAATYKERWPAVFSELVGQKLPEGYQVLAAVDPPGARAQLVEAIKTGKKALKETIGKDAETIDGGLHDALKPFLDTLAPAPNGASLGAAWQNAAQLLAYRYTNLGQNPSDALRQATADLVDAKYDLVAGGGTNARAPKGLGAAAQSFADQQRLALKPEDIEIPPRGRDEIPLTDAQRSAAYFRDGVVNGSRWVTSPKDDGWVLLDSSRQPIMRRTPLPSAGLLEPGNIKNLYDRPVLKNDDGSVSTTRSMSFGEGGKEVLVPTVVDGKQLSQKEAIDHYRQTGAHLGKFDTPANADTYAEELHNEQAARMGIGPSRSKPVTFSFADMVKLQQATPARDVRADDFSGPQP